MATTRIVHFTLLVGLAAGCKSASSAPSANATPVPLAAPVPLTAQVSQKLGSPIDPAVRSVALIDIAQHPGAYAQGTVRTEGEVKAVCQAMGCWMEIGDAKSQAHIRMAGHSFFVPKDASGKHAVVEARVLARPDEGECEEEAAQATGHVVKVELEATGVEIM